MESQCIALGAKEWERQGAQRGGLFPRRTEMDDRAGAPEPKHRPTLVFSGIKIKGFA